MLSIYKKEVSSFLSSLEGYAAVLIFLVLSWLYVWLFPNSNVLDMGYATLQLFFDIVPWVFMVLISAITMRSFSEEFNKGTIELLYTKPITEAQIILGKFLASLTLVLISIVPTFIYYYAIHQLGEPVGNLDSGAIIGSYIGLFCMGGAYVAIGLFASTLTQSQIASFLISAILCFISYQGLDYISELSAFYTKGDSILISIGLSSHYESISRGLVDTRDLVFFFSFIGFFLLLTQISLQTRKW